MSDQFESAAPAVPARTQVLVVGSGAGGAATAATLAENGYDVLLVEEGADIDTAAIDTNSTEAITRLYRNGGMTPMLGNQNIAYVEGRCVGGSTEINSGFWHRLPPDCYHRWRTDAQLDAFSPEMMEAYFLRLETDLSVSCSGRAGEPKSSALFRRGVEHLKWEYAEVPRCQKDPSASPFSGGAKQSMRQTYIPRALAAGARVLAGYKVRRVVHDNGHATGVDVVQANGRGNPNRIGADAIFVCGGAIQTPALLLRSGVRKNVGNSLCIHPMIKAAALFDEPVGAHAAALPIYQVKQFWPTLTIGGAVFTPGFLAMILADNWQANRHVMGYWDRMALYYAGTRGMSRGSIRTIPGVDDGVVIRYRLTEADQRNLSIGLARLGELLFAAGATAVYPSVRSFPALTSAEHCRGFLTSHLPVAAMSLSTVHAFSSCPMGENPDFCATNSFGRVNGFTNLYVNDASLIPDSPGVNPQGTTMAIALRNVDHFIEHARRPRRRSVAATSQKAEILVTGAPGWLGTRLVEILRDRQALETLGLDPALADRRLRCLVQRSVNPAALTDLCDSVDVVEGDLADAESLGAFCRDAVGATLFHVAGLIHPRRRTRDFYLVNVAGTREMLAAAEHANVKRVVAMSSNSPLGCNPHPHHVFDEQSSYNPYMEYGRSKEHMERLIMEAHERGRLETVIIRSPWFYGPHQPPRQTLFFRMIKEGRFPILGNGEQRRSMAYVDNICIGLLLAAADERSDGEVYWIADERPYSMNEIVDTVEAVLEEELGIPRPKTRVRLPSAVGDLAWLCDRGVQALGMYNQKIHVLGEMNKTIACSVDKAKRKLGYSPRYALRDGMSASIRWCLAHGQYI